MKTSTKIFLGLAAAVVAFCIVNIIVTHGQHRKYDVQARNLAEQLDKNPIRVLDVTLSPSFGMDHVSYPLMKNNLWRSDSGQQLYIHASMLDNIRIDGETMYIENYDNWSPAWRLLSSPSIETVVIHRQGQPDEVIEIREEPAPEPEAVPIEPESH